MSQENKFTRSVLERLEQEQAKQKKQPASPKAATIQPTTAPEAPKKKIKKAVEPASTAKPATKEEPPDLSQFISPKVQRTAKNKTFYLDTQVIDGVSRAAKQQKMTDSRLVNEILKGVLGLP